MHIISGNLSCYGDCWESGNDIRQEDNDKIHGSGWWHYRRLWSGDLAVRFIPLRFQSGSVTHRFGVSGGVSIRHRDEEMPRSVSTILPERYDERLGFKFRNLKENERLYIVPHDKIPGGAYVMTTFAETATDVGGVISLFYAPRIGNITPGFGVSLRHYLTGTQVASYGFSFGYSF